MIATTYVILYDVARDGIGWTPWLLTLGWLAITVLVARAMWLDPGERAGIIVWLFVWGGMGAFGFGNVVVQYLRNRAVLRSGAGEVVEGTISDFHRETYKKGDSEHFRVGGQRFEYSSANLGGGGMRGSSGFAPPLRDGLPVRVTCSHGVIIRLEYVERAPPVESASGTR